VWMGHNRSAIHRRAKCGSGGVGFLIKDSVLQQYDVFVLDKGCEGILWISLKNKASGKQYNLCVCYLPPENSTRAVDVCEYLDTLLFQVYEYQKSGSVTVCGDFNSRCGNIPDFIEGVDTIGEREIIDTTRNRYGDLFCDFLIRSNMCILNGRNNGTNDFTSISTRGSAVVDYIIVAYEELVCFQDFHVERATELVNQVCGNTGVESRLVPDHSLLSWAFTVNERLDYTHEGGGVEQEASYVRYNLQDIPSDFMCSQDTMTSLQEAITKIEQSVTSQDSINSIYDSFCERVKNEMAEKLDNRTVRISTAANNNYRRCRKKWWTNNLTELWTDMCKSEKAWLKHKGPGRKELKAVYTSKRRHFDRQVQRRKREHVKKIQNDIADSTGDSQSFWKTIGKIGIANERRKRIPLEIVKADGSVSSSLPEVLDKWKCDYEHLLNTDCNNRDGVGAGSGNEASGNFNRFSFDNPITESELKHAYSCVKNGKSTGVDDIPIEVLRNTGSSTFLLQIFNTCYNNGAIPDVWRGGIITPVPKSSMNDPRDPLSYRGITLTPVMYKLYCNILNNRLTAWAENDGIIVEEQNGFRRGRSTIDHLSTLTSIIETRKKKKMSTFTAFIDFKKAYDSINRDLLWKKLDDLGVTGKMRQALHAIYTNVSCCVRLNGFKTDWFAVNCGVKQGCLLSPLLFNIYINDLAVALKGLGKGVKTGEDIISVLLYADDLVLLAETESDLQLLLDALNYWCGRNCMLINKDKSKVIHFRSPSTKRTDVIFTCGDVVLDIVGCYTYLGLLLEDHLDLNVTAKAVSQSASRALGLVIAKCKSMGGMPYNAFTKLYTSIVLPVITYGASIWGTRAYSVISKIHHRACRYYLGVGKYTPNDGVNGDMGWTPVIVSQWQAVLRQWRRLVNMDSSRLNRAVFIWADQMQSRACKNWNFNIRKFFDDNDMSTYYDVQSCVPYTVINDVVDIYTSKLLNQWSHNVSQNSGKLRSYRMFKTVYGAENYVQMALPRQHRSALAKFRCGVAPIRLETGRYENLKVEERLCPMCDHNAIEDEVHVLINCPIYSDIRVNTECLAMYFNGCYAMYSDAQKFCYLMSSTDMVSNVAKALHLILTRRRALLYL